jgi:hypothetical protein
MQRALAKEVLVGTGAGFAATKVMDQVTRPGLPPYRCRLEASWMKGMETPPGWLPPVLDWPWISVSPDNVEKPGGVASRGWEPSLNPSEGGSTCLPGPRSCQPSARAQAS